MAQWDWDAERAGCAAIWALFLNTDVQPISYGGEGPVTEVVGTALTLMVWSEAYPVGLTVFDLQFLDGDANPVEPQIEGVICVDGSIHPFTELDNGFGTDALSLGGITADLRSMMASLLAGLAGGTEVFTSAGPYGDRQSKLGMNNPIQDIVSNEFVAFQTGGNSGWDWTWTTGIEGIGAVWEFSPEP